VSLEAAGERQLRRGGQRQVGCGAEWLPGLGKARGREAAVEGPSTVDGDPWEAHLWKLAEVPLPRSSELVALCAAGVRHSWRGHNQG
jgi:hypothetical protein